MSQVTVPFALTFADALALLKRHPKVDSADIRVCFKPGSKHQFDEKCHAAGIALGVDWAKVLVLPQKQVKRATQLVNALNVGSVKNLDPTHARALIAMHLAGSYDLTTDAVISLAAGVRKGSIETRGVTMGAIKAMFSRTHGLSTVATKVSNSLGARGMYQVIGVTYGKPGTVNRTFSLNSAHPLYERFLQVINRGSEQDFAHLAGGEE